MKPIMSTTWIKDEGTKIAIDALIDRINDETSPYPPIEMASSAEVRICLNDIVDKVINGLERTPSTAYIKDRNVRLVLDSIIDSI